MDSAMSLAADVSQASRWVLLLVVPLVMFLGACAAFRPATAPIRTIEIHNAAEPRCLVVLLPGRNSTPESFTGFAKGVEERQLPIDLVAVDAHLRYYRTRSVIERVRTDVIGPAMLAGYDEIWIAGTSLGGLGSLLYLRDHPEDLSGVIALAPFLGPDDVIDEIEEAGGPRAWKPPDIVGESDTGRELWSFLIPGGGLSAEVPLYLGWGTGDKFDRSNGILAELLPDGRTLAVDGAHDMGTWIRLWETFLDKTELCRASKPVPSED